MAGFLIYIDTLQSVSFHHIVLMTEVNDGPDESREADESHNQKERC